MGIRAAKVAARCVWCRSSASLISLWLKLEVVLRRALNRLG